MRNPMIVVTLVAVILAAIIVGLTLDDETTPVTQLPRLGEPEAPMIPFTL